VLFSHKSNNNIESSLKSKIFVQIEAAWVKMGLREARW